MVENWLFLRTRACAFREHSVAVGPRGEVFSDRACQHNTTQKKITTDHHEFKNSRSSSTNTVTNEIEEKNWKRRTALHLTFSSLVQHMCGAPTIWDFPSCRTSARWCQLTPCCARHPLICWYDLLWKCTAARVEHMCSINLTQRECGKMDDPRWRHATVSQSPAWSV